MRTALFAMLATGFLLAGAAVPVLADAGHGRHSHDPDHDDDAEMNHTGNHTRGARMHHLAAQCEDEANITANSSLERRCARMEQAHSEPFKARREAHALLGAIAAFERRIERLENRSADLQDQIANSTDENETANLTARLDRVGDHLERMEARLARFNERVGVLHDKWAEVAAHVDAKRHGSDDSDDDSDGEDSDDDEADDEEDDE